MERAVTGIELTGDGRERIVVAIVVLVDSTVRHACSGVGENG